MSLLLASALLAQLQIAVPDSGRPTVEPPSSANFRSIARPNLGADAQSRGRAQAEALIASTAALHAEHQAREAETRRLQCVSAGRKAASCTR